MYYQVIGIDKHLSGNNKSLPTIECYEIAMSSLGVKVIVSVRNGVLRAKQSRALNYDQAP